MAVKKDQRSNIVLASVTASATDTLTFEEISVGLNLFDKVGLNIHLIEWFFSNDVLGALDIASYLCQVALTNSNQINSLGSAERAVVCKQEIFANSVGTPGNTWDNFFPLITDYTQLPMGGLLVPPKPLYLAIDETNAALAGQVYARIFFTIEQLKDADYFELLETFRFYG